LVAPDGKDYDHFGSKVAISDEIIVVSAPWADRNGDKSGSVYLFHINGTFVEQLIPSDGGSGHFFGASIAISVGIIVVGATGVDSDNGAIYIYNTDGKLVQKIYAHDNEVDDGFGYSVAISDGIIVAGTYGDVNGDGSGSVYLYRTDGVLIKKVQLSLGYVEGLVLEISDDIILASAPMHGDYYDGAVYLFRTYGQLIAELVTPNGGAERNFAYSVAISADVVVVGAIYIDDNGSDSGAVYLFRTDGEFI